MPTAFLEPALRSSLPGHCVSLFERKQELGLSFSDIADQLGRNEVSVAAIFYGQSNASEEDAKKLVEILQPPALFQADILQALAAMPFRGQAMEMPPREPLIYRLYEIVQNYGYAYKAILNEKFGDGIMSAISFSTKVEKESDENGDWAVITLRGKWLPYSRF